MYSKSLFGSRMGGYELLSRRDVWWGSVDLVDLRGRGHIRARCLITPPLCGVGIRSAA